MKKINLMIIAILAGAMAFMTSCDGGGETITPKPVITFTSDHSAAIVVGDSVDVVGNVTAEGSLEKITFFKGDDQYGEAITKDFNTKTTHTFSVKVGGDETFNFEVQVEDKEGQISKKSVTITVEESIIFVNSIEIHCAQADQSSVDYASATTGKTWSHDAAENYSDTIALIDFCYYNGNYTKLDRHRMVSPDATPIDIHKNNYGAGTHESLTDANTTKFKVLTGAELDAFADWSNIANDDAILAITDISESNVIDFSVDDIVAFELDNGKKGVFKVISVTDGYTSTDFVKIDVIVQRNVPTTK